MIEGQCFCGFVRYQASGQPSERTNCHCSICRRLSGAAFVTWFTVPRSAFQVLAGEPASLQTSNHGARTFCPRCGTPLTFTSAESPGTIDVTTCSLVDPNLLPPLDHTHVGSKLDWVRILDDLPAFEGARPLDGLGNQGKSESSP